MKGYKGTREERAMKPKRLTEPQLYRKLTALARKYDAAFGIEYFSVERKWRGTVVEEASTTGCWWRSLSLHETRRDALLDLLAELSLSCMYDPKRKKIPKRKGKGERGGKDQS